MTSLMTRLERRRFARDIMTGFVTLTAELGPSKGSTYSAMLRDVSFDGGICVLLDGESGLTRGTRVTITFADAPPMSAWVCHNTRDGDTFRLGVSFYQHWDETPGPPYCRASAQEPGPQHS